MTGGKRRKKPSMESFELKVQLVAHPVGMANVLTKGSILTDNIVMQRVWAWTQCIAIDASVAGTIIRTFRYHAEGERVKTWLYGLLSALLLFTAAIVSNIESVQQTLNIGLDQAYIHVFIAVEALIWIRSIAIVLLIVAHALRHVQREGTEGKHAVGPASPSAPPVVTPELLDAFRSLLAQTTISEEVNPPPALPWPKDEQGKDTAQEGKSNAKCEQGVKNKVSGESDDGPETNNCERVKAYLAEHPNAKVRDVAKALVISVSTANKWMIRIRGKCLQGEQHA